MKETIEILTEKIKNDILKQPKKALSADEPLISSGLIDSFNLVDLAILVEDLFGVHLEDYELTADNFDNIEQLAALIISRA